MITSTIEKAVIKDKKQGLSDVEIGSKYGITYRQLEKIIRKAVGISVSVIKTDKKIKTLYPKDFKEEATTVWSFKNRGSWATHSGEYRGNWSPYIPRNVILKYSKPGEVVLDYFCGAGTTAVEAKLLGRKCIAFDINNMAIELAMKNVDLEIPTKERLYSKIYEPELSVRDTRDLSFLIGNSVDLICAHPPYANIIHYTENKEGDLSYLDIEHFLKEMERVAKESYRILKPGRQCAILIGDMRRHKHVIPLGFKLINVFLNAGFKLKELIIKRQHNCKTTGFWYANSIKYNFLLLAHEYLPIFEKPVAYDYSTVKESAFPYGSVLPFIERLPAKRKLDTLESTTVWILPARDFEKYLNKNIIERYSYEKPYKTIGFSLNSKKEHTIFKEGTSEKKKLLFIKTPFLLDKTFSDADMELYLNGIEEIIQQESEHLENSGYCAIQTKDVRVGDYIEPTAKKIVDILFYNKNLHLKEIIIVTNESNGCLAEEYGIDGLKINHQYLLVYEKR
jgi:DNA modification methylase